MEPNLESKPTIKVQKPWTKNQILFLRIKAFFIDLFLIGVTKALLSTMYFSFLNKFFYHWPIPLRYQVTSRFHEIDLILLLVISSGYFFFSYYLLSGTTPGKLFFKLYVVPNSFLQNPKKENLELTFSQCLSRSLSYVLIMGPSKFLGFFICFFSKDCRGFQDYFSQSQTLPLNVIHTLIAEKEAFELTLQQPLLIASANDHSQNDAA
jgi:hypothetical protein